MGCERVLIGRKLTQCLPSPEDVKMALEEYKLSLEIEGLGVQTWSWAPVKNQYISFPSLPFKNRELGTFFSLANCTVPSALLFTEKILIFEGSLIFFDATDSVELLIIDILSHLKLLFPWIWSYGRIKESPVKSPVSLFLLWFPCNEKLRIYITHFLMFLWLTFFSLLHTSTSYEIYLYYTFTSYSFFSAQVK